MRSVKKKSKAAPELNRAIGAANRERIRAHLIAHPGITRRECAEALKMSEMVVGRHVKVIRKEWDR